MSINYNIRFNNRDSIKAELRSWANACIKGCYTAEKCTDGYLRLLERARVTYKLPQYMQSEITGYWEALHDGMRQYHVFMYYSREHGWKSTSQYRDELGWTSQMVTWYCFSNGFFWHGDSTKPYFAPDIVDKGE